MTAVRRIEARTHPGTDFNPIETYHVTLTQDDLTTLRKSSAAWNVAKQKALEVIINGGLSLIREVLPPPGLQRAPEIP